MFSHTVPANRHHHAKPLRTLILWFLLTSLLPFAVYAVPTEWEWAHPTPHGNQHNSVIWGDDEFIAVGEGGNIISSPSGNDKSWLAEPSNTTENLNDIAWSGVRYVSVGDQGTIVSRTSSRDWAIATSTITHQLTDVIWNGTQFLAIGDYTASFTDPINGAQSRPAAAILTSATGASWRLETPTLNPDRHSNVPPPRLRGITWDGSLYVASSDDGAILTSVDGIAWHTRSINSIASNGKPGAAKRFLAVGDNGLTLSSNNGINWTKRTPGITDNLHDVIWAEVHFVVAGANGTIISTNDDDAITWQTETSDSTTTLRDITFNEILSVVMVVGDNGTILTRSLSPLTWTLQAEEVTSEDLHSVAWSSAITSYVAVGSSGTILASANATEWEAVSDPPTGLSSDLLHVSWHATGSGFFLASGKDGTLLTTTTDVDTWVSRSSNIPDEWLFDSAWDGTHHIVVGSNGTLLTSTNLDGSIWTTQQAQTSEHLLSIAIDNTTTLIGGEYNTQLLTSDPTNIIASEILIGSGRITSQHLNDILFDDGKYIAIGNAGTIITSDNTNYWTTPSSIIDAGSSITNDLLSIGIENVTDNFFITGAWGTFLSGDSTGDTWISKAITTAPLHSPSASFFYGVASSNNSTVALVGSGGDVYSSFNNGVHWNLTAGPVITREAINDLTKSDTLLIAVGDNGTILNSNNAGISWADQTPTSSCGANRLHAVTWSDVTNRFVAVGDVGTICYSNDGTTWVSPPISSDLPSSASTLYGITWGENQFVAVGGSALNSAIYTSPFGEKWTPRDSNESNTLHEIIWNEDHFIAIGDGGTITTSPKGISWTRNNSGTSVNLNNIAIGENRIIVTGTDTGTSNSPASTTILSNSDGTWIGGNSQPALPNILISDLGFGGTQFIAVAPSGTIMVSPDGTEWTEVLTGTNSLFKTVLWDDSKFIAAGAAAHILFSKNVDLVISGDFTVETVREGEAARYVLSITNRGFTTAERASYTGELARNSTFLSATTTHGSCAMGSALICDFGNLATGETVTLTVDIVTTALGQQGHTATVGSNAKDDSDEGNNSITITLQVTRGDPDGGGAAMSYWWLASMLSMLFTYRYYSNYRYPAGNK